MRVCLRGFWGFAAKGVDAPPDAPFVPTQAVVESFFGSTLLTRLLAVAYVAPCVGSVILSNDPPILAVGEIPLFRGSLLYLCAHRTHARVAFV